MRSIVKFAVILVAVTLVSLPTKAEEVGPEIAPRPLTQLEECEDLLSKADEVIYEQSETIRLLVNQNRRLQESLDHEIYESTNRQKWYEHPAIVAPLSVILGFIAAKQLQ